MITTIKLGSVNVYLMKGDGYVLVDTGASKQAKQLLKGLEEHNIPLNEIKLIILTHSHADHMNGLEALVKLTNAQVMIQKQEKLCLEGKLEHGISYAKWYIKPFLSMATKASDRTFDIVVEDTYDLGVFGIPGKVYHTPGHTRGSLSILLDNGSVIVGDHLMAIRRGALPHKPVLAFNVNAIRSSMEMLIENGGEKFYLSHGTIYDKNTILQSLNKLGS